MRMDTTPGWIYFIQCQTTGLIKIGWTKGHPDWRLGLIQAMCPTMLDRLGAMSGVHEDEARVHARFAEHREHGEWFRPAGAIIEFILANGIDWPKAEKEPPRKKPVPVVSQFENPLSPGSGTPLAVACSSSGLRAPRWFATPTPDICGTGSPGGGPIGGPTRTRRPHP